MCYKALFCKKGLIKNYGSYSLILILIIHLVILILFYVNNSYKKIMKLLVNILFGTNKLENLKTNKLNEYKKHKKLKKKLLLKYKKNLNIKNI